MRNRPRGHSADRIRPRFESGVDGRIEIDAGSESAVDPAIEIDGDVESRIGAGIEIDARVESPVGGGIEIDGDVESRVGARNEVDGRAASPVDPAIEIDVDVEPRVGARIEIDLGVESRVGARNEVGYSCRLKYKMYGLTHRVLEPMDLMACLSAIVPPPRFPLTRFERVFTSASPWRARGVPSHPAGGRMRIVATVLDAAEVQRVLAHLRAPGGDVGAGTDSDRVPSPAARRVYFLNCRP